MFTVPSFLQSWALAMEAGEDDGSMEKVLKELKALVCHLFQLDKEKNIDELLDGCQAICRRTFAERFW